jgi:hypothetical protein
VLDVVPVPVSAVKEEWALITRQGALDTPLTTLVSHRPKDNPDASEQISAALEIVRRKFQLQRCRSASSCLATDSLDMRLLEIARTPIS